MSISNEQVLGLRSALESNEVVLVTFEKANGDLRDMVCTISPEVSGDTYEFVGESKEPSQETDPDNQLVWEPAIKQWRKFKYSAVQKWAVSH